MPTTATQPARPHTRSPAPGIGATEAELITAAARRFLERADTGFHETMAAIYYQTGALVGPYIPASVGDYDCQKPNSTHWCL